MLLIFDNFNTMCFWIRGSCSFLRFGKFSSVICLNRFFVPFSLSSYSGMLIILILFFLMSNSSHKFFSFFFYSQVSYSICVISRFLSSISPILSSVWSALFPKITNSLFISLIESSLSSSSPEFLFGYF